jgi:hypothetical protein
MIVYQVRQLRGKMLEPGRFIKKRISDKYARAYQKIRKQRRE